MKPNSHFPATSRIPRDSFPFDLEDRITEALIRYGYPTSFEFYTKAPPSSWVRRRDLYLTKLDLSRREEIPIVYRAILAHCEATDSKISAVLARLKHPKVWALIVYDGHKGKAVYMSLASSRLEALRRAAAYIQIVL